MVQMLKPVVSTIFCFIPALASIYGKLPANEHRHIRTKRPDDRRFTDVQEVLVVVRQYQVSLFLDTHGF